MDVGLVSFVIRVRNTPKHFLLECLRSVLSQTYDNIEIVMVFDKGDPDKDAGISEVISSFPNEKKLQVFFREKGAGLADAMNYGLLRSRGKFIAVLDSDDKCSEKRIEHQLQYMLEKNLNFVGSWAKVISEDGTLVARFKPPTSHNDIRNNIMIHNPFYHSSILYEKDILSKVGNYIAYPGSEEYDFYLRVISGGYKVGNVPEFLCDYRQRKDSFVASSKWKQRKGYLKIKFNAVRKYHYVRLTDLFYATISIAAFFVPLGKESLASSSLGWYEVINTSQNS
ncbi:MAG: glycosyltransferase [Nitrososphaeraceae archaeon]